MLTARSHIKTFGTHSDHISAQEYESLCERLREMSTLGGISGLLGWGGHAVTCLSIPARQPGCSFTML